MTKKARRENFGNRVPAGERWLAAIVVLVALAFAYYALFLDDLYVPGKSARWYRSETPGVHLHGWAVYWMFLAFANVALIAFTFILDHYDRRFNAGFYRGLRRVLLFATSSFVVVGIGEHLSST
jgi:hypothetical protein